MKPELLLPASLVELFALLQDENDAADVSFVAGGTDWTLGARERNWDGVRFISLSDVADLKGIFADERDLFVGAMQTMTSIAESAHLKQHAACLCEAASRVGSWQIRNRATLGGNLANASPAADTPVALAALDARAKLVSPKGERELPVQEIPNGPNKNALLPRELIAGFYIPIRERRVSAFGKVGSRSEVSIARLNLAVSLTLDEKNTIGGARVYLGTLGNATLRAPRAEDALEGGNLAGECELQEPFCDALAATVAEAIPRRATLPYKRSAVRALGEDVLDALRRRAGIWEAER